MAGRKGEKWWRDALRIAVNEQMDGDPSGRKKLRALADVLVAKALEGDVTALKEIGDRLDGRPAQEITGDDDNPLTVVQRVEIVAARHDDGES